MVEKTKQQQKPEIIDPSMSMIVFLLITIVYFIAKHMAPSNNTTLFIIYVCLVLITQYMSNLSLAKQLCNTSQSVKTASFATFVPWILIFGLLNLCLTMFPGWLSPFSNTLGYMVAIIVGVDRFYMKILNDSGASAPASPNDAREMWKVIKNMKSDPSFILNSLNDDDEEIQKFWDKSIKEQIFKSTSSEDLEDFKGFIRLKDNIGYFVWYILTGLLITSISYNYMISVKCNKSPTQALADASTIINDNAANDASNANVSAQAPVYKDLGD